MVRNYKYSRPLFLFMLNYLVNILTSLQCQYSVSILSMATCRVLEICGTFRLIVSIRREASLDKDFCYFSLFIEINSGKYLKTESSCLNSHSFHFVRIVAGDILRATISNKSIQNALRIFNLDDKMVD